MRFTELSGNNELIKKINLDKVLNTILLHQPLSRAQISVLTNINKVTVSSCVDFFIEKGLIVEIGVTESTTRGRPPTLLRLNHEAGICIGIEVEYKELKILVLDLLGTPLEQRTVALEEKDPAYFISYLSSLVAEMKMKYARYPLGILAVGIALAGHYNPQTGYIEYVANLQSWNRFPIVERIHQIDPSIRYFINSTVNAGAMGEIQSFRTNAPEVFVYIGGLWGLGVGVCIQGKVFPGYSGFAGRLGHSTIHYEGKRCACGNIGCWELYGSADALYQALYPNNKPASRDFNVIVKRLKRKDPEVIKEIESVGYYHALGLINVINAYNPEVICIGGYLGLLGSPFIDVIYRTLQEKMSKHFLNNLNIYCSEYGEFQAAFGSISPLNRVLSEVVMNHIP